MILYLSGPMRGHVNANRDRFSSYTCLLSQLGHRVISPWHVSLAMGEPVMTNDQPYLPETSKPELVSIAAMNLASIARAEAITLMPDWEESYGCLMELHYALFLGLKVFQCGEISDRQPLTIREVRPCDLELTHHIHRE